jgi:hypothetical protein
MRLSVLIVIGCSSCSSSGLNHGAGLGEQPNDAARGQVSQQAASSTFRPGFAALQLSTFLTVGPKEARA